MSGFQVGSIIFFIAIAIFALLMFAGIIPRPGCGDDCNGPKDVSLVIWGTLPNARLSQALIDLKQALGNNLTVTYQEKNVDNLYVDLLSAGAKGQSPDIVLFPGDYLFQIKDALETIPAETISLRTIRDSFIEGSDVFVTPTGIYALPFLVDPLVMYWNRDLFNADRITAPPTTWDEVISLTRFLTKTDNRGNILQSATALGESRNIDHFKDILSLFFLQVGDRIVTLHQDTREPFVSFGTTNSSDVGSAPAVSALAFYTGFANIRAPQYSWNGSFSSSLDEFVGGKVALYFAPASEYQAIVNKNPHLNFDVAPVPQLTRTQNVTSGTIYGVGFPKGGKQLDASFTFATALTMTSEKLPPPFIETFKLPPARRSLLSKGAQDAALSLFYKEALITRGWLDPDPARSETIFAQMVNNTLSGAQDATQTISGARQQLTDLLKDVTESQTP